MCVLARHQVVFLRAVSVLRDTAWGHSQYCGLNAGREGKRGQERARKRLENHKAVRVLTWTILAEPIIKRSETFG